MVELLRLLSDKHRELKAQLVNEAMPLTRMTIKDAQAMGWEQLARPIEEIATQTLNDDPAINPLRLPKSLLTKNLVKKA